jgi:hypothetical protein
MAVIVMCGYQIPVIKRHLLAPGYQMVTKLDHFKKKRVPNKILFIIKWSSLAIQLSNAKLHH